MIEIKKYKLTDTCLSGYELRTLNNLVIKKLVLEPEAIIKLSELGEKILKVK